MIATLHIFVAAGLVLFLLSRLLLRVEAAEGSHRLPEGFGDALWHIGSWMALAGLFFSAFTGYGLPGAAAAILTALAATLMPAPRALTALTPFRGAITLAAILAAIGALFGIVSLYEGVFYG